jgi:hypothetical protein
MVGLEAAKAGFDGVHDMSSGGAYVVTAGPDATEYLRRENDILSSDAEILEGLAQALFAFTFGIDIGRVEQVNAGIDAGLDELVGARLVDIANGLPEALATVKGHGAKAER